MFYKLKLCLGEMTKFRLFRKLNQIIRLLTNIIELSTLPGLWSAVLLAITNLDCIWCFSTSLIHFIWLYHIIMSVFNTLQLFTHDLRLLAAANTYFKTLKSSKISFFSSDFFSLTGISDVCIQLKRLMTGIWDP